MRPPASCRAPSSRRLRFGEHHPQCREYPPRIPPMHRHAEPVGRLLAVHGVDALGDRPHPVAAPHRRQGPEKEPERQRNVLRKGSRSPHRRPATWVGLPRPRAAFGPGAPPVRSSSPGVPPRAAPRSTAVSRDWEAARFRTARPPSPSRLTRSSYAGADAIASMGSGRVTPRPALRPRPSLRRTLRRWRTAIVVPQASPARRPATSDRRRTPVRKCVSSVCAEESRSCGSRNSRNGSASPTEPVKDSSNTPPSRVSYPPA